MMTPEMQAKLKRSLIQHEGLKDQIYIDTLGNYTGGIGYNFTSRGIPDWFTNTQYEKDVNYFYNQLHDDFPWFKDLTDIRQIVLVDMAFMGYKNFLSFRKMLAYLALHDYPNAAHEILNSKWAAQVGQRANDLADAMLTGIYHV